MGRIMTKRLQLRARKGGISIDRLISFAIGEVDPDRLARVRGPLFSARDGWHVNEKFAELKELAREARATGSETRFLDALDRREPLGSSEAEVGSGDPLFRDFAKEWVEVVLVDGAYTESSLLSDRGDVRKHLVPFFGHLRLSAIDVRQVDRYKAKKLRQKHQFGVGYASSTINNHISLLRRILMRAVEYGLLDRVPMTARTWLPPDRTAEDTDNWLRPHEEAQLVRWLWVNWLNRPGDRLMLLTSLLAGLRFSETRALRKEDLDVAGRGIHIRRSQARRKVGTPKNKRPRFQPLPPPLVDELRRHLLRTKGQLMFTGDGGGPVSNNVFNRRLRKACRAADVREVTSHGLRRAAGSSYAYLGQGQRVIADLLGHADVKATERYTRVYEQAKHAAVAQRWDRMEVAEGEVVALPMPGATSAEQGGE